MRRLLLIVAALPLSLLSYFFIGIAIPRINGVGRFYSVPFGGYSVGDESILLSAGAWFVLWVVLLSLLFRERKVAP
jgi:hypothetical protein